MGTVAEAFRLNHRDKFEAIMQGHDGPAAIGHVRYATCGGDDRSYAQPFEREHGRKAKWFAFAFNGQLANYQELKRELLEQGRLPPEARHRHRDHHALAQLRAPGRGRGGRLGRGLRPPRREVRRGLQHRPADRQRRAGRGARPAGLPPALHRRGRPAVRRRQRERPAGQPRLHGHPLAGAGDPGGRQRATASGSSGSPPPPGRPTASSSGSTSPTSPARSTTARST